LATARRRWPAALYLHRARDTAVRHQARTMLYMDHLNDGLREDTSDAT
jgi:hypothetical protein